MNSSVFTATVAQDPRIAPSQKVGQLRAAISNGKDEAGQWRDSTYVDVKVFGDLARAIGLYRSGDRIVVQGRLAHETWADRTTGANRSKIIIIATEIRTVSPIGQGMRAPGTEAVEEGPPAQQQGDDDDDIPF